jgi:hypothetical protein
MQKLMAYRRYVREGRIVQLASTPHGTEEAAVKPDARLRAALAGWWDDQFKLTDADVKAVQDFFKNLPSLNSQSGGRRSTKANPANARIARWARASYASNGKGKAKGGKARSGGMSTGSTTAAAASQGGGAPVGA